MTTQLTQKAASIQAFLLQEGVDSQVKEFSEKTRTAKEAAAQIGCDLAQIAMSLIFKLKRNQTPIQVMVSGCHRLNTSIIEDYLKEPIEKADADFVRQITGYAIGGVPPFCHRHPIDLVFIDEVLLGFDELWVAAGNPHAVVKLSKSEFTRLIKGIPVRL